LARDENALPAHPLDILSGGANAFLGGAMDPWVLRNSVKVRPLSWVEVQHAERDICLLYHQLAKVFVHQGGPVLRAVYGLPYWDYLSVSNLELERAVLLRDGCLMMMLAMAWETIDGAGSYLSEERLRLCLAAVQRLEGVESSYDDPRTERLIGAVKLALGMAQADKVSAELEARLMAESAWVHREYVRGYFREHVHDFETNRTTRKND
jgi:hypothetical protein